MDKDILAKTLQEFPNYLKSTNENGNVHYRSAHGHSISHLALSVENNTKTFIGSIVMMPPPQDDSQSNASDLS